MDAIVTAGGIFKPDDPLFLHTKVEKKALIPLLGRPMVSWILDALRGSGLVEHIALVGLTRSELNDDDKQLYFIESTGNLVDNVFAGLHKLQTVNPAVKKLLLFSSDIPLVTPEIVRGFIEECGSQEADIYYAVVEEKTMEARFPHSKRTFVPLKGGRYCGGDSFLVDVAAAKANTELIRSLTGSRKNFVQQARLIGFSFIFRFLFRMMDVYEAAQRAAERANLNGRVVVTSFAELGMDVDKLHQYDMIKATLQQRNAQNISK
jgi:GTP:adenosylcobinamide-phosphate guanylyltransferase